MRVSAAADLQRRAGSVRRPAAVLLDAGAADATSDWSALGRPGRASYPGVPILVATARGALPDRLRAVQLGAAPLPAEAGGARRAAAGGGRRAPRARATRPPALLCVDDDPHQLDAVRALLEPHGLEVHTSSDPLHFWTRLGEVRPDLLVLDIDMPHVNGIEPCRVGAPTRAGARSRWSSSPRAPEAETVYRVFAAGADDYVAKPFVGPERSPASATASSAREADLSIRSEWESCTSFVRNPVGLTRPGGVSVRWRCRAPSHEIIRNTSSSVSSRRERPTRQEPSLAPIRIA